LSLLNVLESNGSGPLITPSTGALDVLCAQFETIQSSESGRLLEVRTVFIEAGSVAVPVATADFVSALVGAVATGISIAVSQFAADTVSTTTRSSKSVRASFGCPTNVLERELRQIVHKEQLRGTRSQQFCQFLSPARCQSGLVLGQKWTHCQQPLRV
jgi:prophage DNA circulation protein